MNPPNHNDNNDDEAVMAAPANIADVVEENEEVAAALLAANNNGDEAAAANDDTDEDDDDDADDDEDDDDNDDDDEEDEDSVVDVAILDLLDPEIREQICTEATTLLQNRLNLPSRLRDRTMVRFAQQFIQNVREFDVEAAAVETTAPAHAAAAAGVNEDEEENEDAVVAANNNDDDAAANNIEDDEDEPDDADEVQEVDADNVDVATLDVLDPAEREQICQEALAMLQPRLNFPSRLRDRLIVRLCAQQFIRNIKEDIHKLLTDRRTVDEGYDGLDNERDTEEEVETAIRCSPEVLTRREERFGAYPIQCLLFMISEDNKIICNVKAVSFVPLIARLAIEFNSFQNEERGGLLIPDPFGNIVLRCLTDSEDPSCDESLHQLVDTTFAAVLIRLRRSGYLVKNDIQQYNLVHKICRQKQFSIQRFRFLIEWDPSSLLQTDEDDSCLPLHWVADNLQAFQVVLDSLFRYYPRWRGINALFQKDNDDDTPFQLACERFPRTKVTEVVEEILVRYTNNNNNNNNGNVMILAASEDIMSLDGLFFLIRRQPDTMLSMLRHRYNNTNHIVNRNSNDPGVDSTASEENNCTEEGRHNRNTHNAGDNINDGHGSNIQHNTVPVFRRSTRKRKRN